ncbi:NEDD4-binding protein 2-like 2 isoform 2-T2 [Anomaloglossus baeobatrachus]|uniref:NEDD4-binding protein 2-like 2 isoform X2 n=1 Tax=Anomaloglossus baeobatrachus TaxID=238106 RepID=UPI003F503C2A
MSSLGLMMPHAEKNLSHYIPDSSIEPCLKKSRQEASSCDRTDAALSKERGAKSQNWDFFTGSEERCHQSNKCGSEGDSGYIDVKYESDSLCYRLGQSDARERGGNKTNQHASLLPKSEKPENNSDVMFSGTSTSFIGPLCKPSPQTKPLPEVPSNANAASSFRIATVELGKLASQSKGQDGMDYELRQFYKELDELEAVAEDQTKKETCTEVDSTQHIDSYPGKTPALYPPNHGQGPTSLPFGPFPSVPSHFLSLTCHAREEPRPQLERPPLPPNNQFSCYGQAPYYPAISPSVSQAVPPPRGPPRFDSTHPPTFIVPYGPPPPRFNYPVTFQRPSNTLPPPPPPPRPNFSYVTRNEAPPWHRPPAPPESRFPSPEIPYIKPFSQSTSKRTWQDPQQSDHCRPEDGQLGERILPHTDNVSQEQYSGKFRDSGRRRMVLLRGVPGSGKSTLARTVLHQSPDGIVLSTDDYFSLENGYTYDVKLLGDAHNWNHNRARRAMDDGRSPVVIDNTNIKAWEMKPYVQMAVDRGYDVEFLEPDTWWKQDAQELEKRNTHRVPRDKISQMLERYEHDMTVPVVMNSVEPRRVRSNRPPPEAPPRWGASVDCSHNSSSFHSR